MPSRKPPPQPLSDAAEVGQLRSVFMAFFAGAFAVLFLLLLVYVVRKLIYKCAAVAPSELKKRWAPCRFSHSVLRRATSSFSDANRLGKGGVGTVYSGVLGDGRSVAVKVMDSGSLLGGREFRNEILLAGRIGESERVLSILGFAAERRKKRIGTGKELVLVYDLMRNGSLQDALLHKKCAQLMEWKVRFGIALDVADGIYFLHFVCDPPVIHCDIKPSNVLLDCGFRAKLADFGLASVKCRKGYCQAVDLVEEEMRYGTEISNEMMIQDDQNQFVATGFEDGAGCSGLDRYHWPDNLCRDVDLEMSLSSPIKVFEKHGSGLGTDSGTVKICPPEWTGREVIARPRCEGVDSSPAGAENAGWVSYNEFNIHINEKRRKLPREWWKEEFCAELTNKSVKKRGGGNGEDLCWQSDNEGESGAKRMSTKMTIINRCYGKLSFEILKNRRNNQDGGTYGDPPKSHCVTSTPSMKGTVCYTAPEFSCAGQLSEMCDVYSFGVLLLVLISGRRPLEMTSSLMLDFERANLVSWARQLAQDDKLLDLVDPNIKSLDKEQALRCLTVALLCLQRSPAKRPSAKEIVHMLSHCSDPPHLPLKFSPSPPQVSSRIPL